MSLLRMVKYESRGTKIKDVICAYVRRGEITERNVQDFVILHLYQFTNDI